MIKPLNEQKEKLDTYVSDHMVDLTPTQIRGLQNKTEAWTPKILQINVADANIVDRCESCHLGIREPVKLTAAAMSLKGKKPDEYARAFTSHPEPELLKTHDPEKFGCSPCHQGNGRATTSVEKAHGTYEHWLWPLFPRGNVEAGCQTCHAADMKLVSGDVEWQVINEGKDLFRQRGCVGCHRYEGYDKEPEDLLSIAQQIKQLEQEKKDNLKQAADLMKQADAAATNEEANRLNDHAVALKVANSKLDLRIVQLDRTTKSLLQDMKKVGPNLKDVRLKLNKNWIPVWLKKPSDFRPTTKMPNFRLNDEQIKAISAYIWQSALTDPLPKHKAGKRGARKRALRNARLPRLPFHRRRPADGRRYTLPQISPASARRTTTTIWCAGCTMRANALAPIVPYEKKDIGPEDYAKKGLPYVFDLEHSRCPNDGHELQVQNMTVMPSLRLSPQDAEDVASYLVTFEETQDPSAYPDASFMDDPNLQGRGQEVGSPLWLRRLSRNLRSGGRRPHRHGTHRWRAASPSNVWTSRCSRKRRSVAATNPSPIRTIWRVCPKALPKLRGTTIRVFSNTNWRSRTSGTRARSKPETEKLRMPNLHLDKDQVRALTTFLMGSQESGLPASYQYRPLDYRRDIQEGWWIVQKYNCVGCHQFTPGQKTALMSVKRYQDAQEQLPPKLLTEGARVDPEWLLHFLNNPALNESDTNRNGVRSYLQVRMPTFSFSENELGKLVRFFQALSRQPLPYIPDAPATLTAKETDMARSLFSSPAAPCLKCHATGDPAHDRTATAPNFLLAKAASEGRLGGDAGSLIRRPSVQARPCLRDCSSAKTITGFSRARRQHPSRAMIRTTRKLLVDYILQLTPEEQRRVGAAIGHTRALSPSASTSAGAAGGERPRSRIELSSHEISNK